MAYFIKLYKTQSTEVSDTIREFIHQGRFEFINGGYVMHDEATSYYQHFIDQMRLGLLFLKSEFDYVPKIAWFIDPFGHSAANAYVLSKMGFEKIAIVRIDYKEKDIRRREKSLEFFYIPFASYDKAKIFTHVTYEHYCPPGSLSDFSQDNELILTPSQIENYAMQAVNELKVWNSGFRHNNVMLMYGCDFTFYQSNANYKIIEKIMEYINNNENTLNMVMKYSTPSKYFEEIFDSVSNWPEYKTEDFLPYAEQPYSYWTGFFTSRPFLKGMIRKTANYLVSSTHLLLEFLLGKKSHKSSIFIEQEIIKNLFEMRETLAICQPHDAVTGSAKEYVSENYIALMRNSTDKVIASIKGVIQYEGENEPSAQNKNLKMSSFSKKNQQLLFMEKVPFVSSESPSDSGIKNSKYLIHNPGLSGLYQISYDFENSFFKLYLEQDDGKVTPIETSIVCIDKITGCPLKSNCTANFYLEFNPSKLFYKVLLHKTLLPSALVNEKLNSFKIDNDEVLFAYNVESENKNEFLFMLKQNQLKYKFNLSHAYYDSFDDSDVRPPGSNPSGAYVLSPSKENPDLFKVIPEKSFIVKGNKFIQITLRFEQSFMIIKLINNKFLEIETIWDEIIEQNVGKEFLLLVTSDIQNNVKFPNEITHPEIWTDSNGMKMMRRYKDFRGGYNYYVTEKIASNFYPVNFMVSMRDRLGHKYDPEEYDTTDNNDRMITLINDRPQSMGVMKQGEFIAILNRYSKRDDWKGLDEPLLEKDSSKYLQMKHYLAFGNDFDRQHLRSIIHNKPTFFANKNLSGDDFKSKLNTIVKCSSYVDVNYHILNQNVFFVQFYNYHDFYFDRKDKNNEGECTFMEADIPYKIKEFNLRGVISIDQSYSEIGVGKNSNRIIKLSPQEFKLFKITIN